MVNQYIAVALGELNEKALDYNRGKVSECMQIVCTYLAWVKTDKIQKRLIGGLRLQKHKDFSFMPTESLQPLFTIPLVVEDLKDETAKQKNHVSKIESAALYATHINSTTSFLLKRCLIILNLSSNKLLIHFIS